MPCHETIETTVGRGAPALPPKIIATSAAREGTESESISRRLYCTAMFGFLANFNGSAALQPAPEREEARQHQ